MVTIRYGEEAKSLTAFRVKSYRLGKGLQAKPLATLRPVGLKLICLGIILERHDLDLMITHGIGTHGNGIGVSDGGGFDKLEKGTEEGVLFGIGI
jgi:hypothetical protein